MPTIPKLVARRGTLQPTYSQLRGGTVPMLNVRERAPIERIVAREGLLFCFLVWLSVRVLLSLWAPLTMIAASPRYYEQLALHYPEVSLPSHDLSGYTVGIWNVYDTRHYITIAEQGYEADPDYLTTFFPGYPLLIKLASFLLLGHSLLAAIVVSNLAALFFLWYLYRLVEADYGTAVAKRAVVISTLFPTAFYLFMGYTMSTLLAFTVAALYYGRQGKWWLAGTLAAAAALMKQPGIALVVPLAYMYWRQNATCTKEGRTIPAGARVGMGRWVGTGASSLLKRLDWCWLLLAPLATVGYIAYRYIYLGASVSDITDMGAGEALTWPGLPLLNSLLALRADNPYLVGNAIDLSFTLLMIGLVAGVVWKLRSTTYTIYSLILVMANLSITWPHLVRPEVDVPRRMLMIFPIFIFVAVTSANPRAFRLVVGVSSAGFLALSGLFVNWFFVS